jgi:hypothetical protein
LEDTSGIFQGVREHTPHEKKNRTVQIINGGTILKNVERVRHTRNAAREYSGRENPVRSLTTRPVAIARRGSKNGRSRIICHFFLIVIE